MKPSAAQRFEEARETLYEACSYVRTDDPRALPLAIRRYVEARQALDTTHQAR